MRAAVEYLLGQSSMGRCRRSGLVARLVLGDRRPLIEVGTWMQRVLDDGLEASERARNIARLEVLLVGMWRKPDEAAIDPLTDRADFFHSDGDLLTEAKARSSIGCPAHAQESTRLRGRGRSLQQAFDLAASLADPFGSALVGLMVDLRPPSCAAIFPKRSIARRDPSQRRVAASATVPPSVLQRHAGPSRPRF